MGLAAARDSVCVCVCGVDQRHIDRDGGQAKRHSASVSEVLGSSSARAETEEMNVQEQTYL